MSLENLDLSFPITFPYAGLIRAFNVLIYVVNFQGDSEVFRNLFDP